MTSVMATFKNTLQAVRDHRWKLHVHRDGQPVAELYDLQADPGETVNRYADEPGMVAALNARLAACREDLGDDACGIAGCRVRPIGRVANPDTLTHLDPNHPYIMAHYDLKPRG